MILSPKNQINLYCLDSYFSELITLYKKNKLPNKILLSGQKGIGKSTLAYHLINCILSADEDLSYDEKNLLINKENKSYKLIHNETSPNFILVDVLDQKKSIDLNQIRDLIKSLTKSSFNSKPRFILIDNIELLNINSINALLKIIEEPSDNVKFILIHNNKKLLPTLKSRCLNFRISLSNKDSFDVIGKLLNAHPEDLINKDLLTYYSTPGKIYNLVKFSEEQNISLQSVELKKLLLLLIDRYYSKNKDVI